MERHNESGPEEDAPTQVRQEVRAPRSVQAQEVTQAREAVPNPEAVHTPKDVQTQRFHCQVPTLFANTYDLLLPL